MKFLIVVDMQNDFINVSLKPVKEKEVFSQREAQAFLRRIDELSDEFINRKICLKILLLVKDFCARESMI